MLKKNPKGSPITPPIAAKKRYLTMKSVLYERDHTPIAFIMPISRSSLLMADFRLKSIVIIVIAMITTATTSMLAVTMIAKSPSLFMKRILDAYPYV